MKKTNKQTNHTAGAFFKGAINSQVFELFSAKNYKAEISHEGEERPCWSSNGFKKDILMDSTHAIWNFYKSQNRRIKYKNTWKVCWRQPLKFMHWLHLKCPLVWLHASVGKSRGQSETPTLFLDMTSVFGEVEKGVSEGLYDSDQTSTLSSYSKDIKPQHYRLLETIKTNHIKSLSWFISVTTGSSGLSGQCSSLFGSIYPSLVPSPATYMSNNLSTCLILFRTHQHPPYYIDCLLFCLVSFNTKENLSFMRL